MNEVSVHVLRDIDLDIYELTGGMTFGHAMIASY